MSFEGQLMRGLKWSKFADKQGNFPRGITNSEKMNDLKFYQDFVKGKDEERVMEILKETSVMARSSRKKLPAYKNLVDELKNMSEKKTSKTSTK